MTPEGMKVAPVEAQRPPESVEAQESSEKTAKIEAQKTAIARTEKAIEENPLIADVLKLALESQRNVLAELEKGAPEIAPEAAAEVTADDKQLELATVRQEMKWLNKMMKRPTAHKESIQKKLDALSTRAHELSPQVDEEYVELSDLDIIDDVDPPSLQELVAASKKNAEAKRETGVDEHFSDAEAAFFSEGDNLTEEQVESKLNDSLKDQRFDVAAEIGVMEAKIEALAPEVKRLEGDLGMKWGIRPEVIAASPAERLKLGVRMVFNKELRNTWNEFQSKLEEVLDANEKVDLDGLLISKPAEYARLMAVRADVLMMRKMKNASKTSNLSAPKMMNQ